MIKERSSGAGTGNREWFLYLEESYRGPFTAAQVESTLRTGSLHPHSLAWKEGMSDWAPLNELEAFKSLAAEAPAAADGPTTVFPIGEVIGLDEPALSDLLSFLEEPFAAPFEEGTITFPLLDGRVGSTLVTPVVEFDPTAGSTETTVSAPAAAQRNRWSLTQLLFGGALLTGAVIYAIFTYWKFDSFSALTDLPYREARELKRVASEPFAQMGPASDFALVPASASDPRFYVAGNLPEDAPLELRAEGVAETLVDAFQARASTSLRLRRGFAKSPPLRQENGKALPRGDYNVSLSSKGEVLAQKIVFLGGAKDKDYAQKLRTYHAALKMQAEAELEEVRQLTETLEKQLNETRAQFAKVARGWDAFHKRWTQMQEQIDIMFKEWTMKSLETDFYYGPLYAAVKEASDWVGRLHAQQNAEYDTIVQPKSQAVPVETLVQNAQRAILSVRAKIAQAERQSVTEAGLPLRLKD